MHRIRIFSVDVICLFCLFAFIFIPLTLNGQDFQFQFSLLLFEKLVFAIQHQFFPNAISNVDFSSDTVGFNLLLVVLFLGSVLLLLVARVFKVKLLLVKKLFFNISPHYIGLILLKYGLDKITLQQFTMPEANILYTPFGYLDKDILFWSTFGTSKFYNIAVGCIEITASILLFFRKTRLLGFCLALGIILNILIINLGFDISVKTLSSFLLLVILINLYPFVKPLYSFFIRNEVVKIDHKNDFHLPFQNLVKILGLLFIFGFVGYPYLANAFAGNITYEPIFNKAYAVKGEYKPYKRVFFHKNSYIIFQTDADEMIDYHYKIDTLSRKIIMEDYNSHHFDVKYEIDTAGNVKLQLSNGLNLFLNPIEVKNLPALKDSFHYTIDEIK